MIADSRTFLLIFFRVAALHDNATADGALISTPDAGLSKVSLPDNLIIPEIDFEYPDHPGFYERVQGLPDVSREKCWVGEYSMERCCIGSEEETQDCWDDLVTFDECCPNADCWVGNFGYNACCSGEIGIGNEKCWGGVYNYERCCALTQPSTSFLDNLYGGAPTDMFYGFDEFYGDSQYGMDFGYYSVGRVLADDEGQAGESATTNEFAHFTTYPMALSPHFGAVLARNLYLMWRKEKKEVFNVVEMGAGSGQLGQDIRTCVLENCLSLTNSTHAEFSEAFAYTILERSPALARRQRQRNLDVVVNDAQNSEASCAALQQEKESQNKLDWRADVVLSNELIDAFAPIKIRMGLFDYEKTDRENCEYWHETKLMHLIKLEDLRGYIGPALGMQPDQVQQILENVEVQSHEFFCGATRSLVGQAAMSIVPTNSTCLNVVLGLTQLSERNDVGPMPTFSHNFRLRLKRDPMVRKKFLELVKRFDVEHARMVVLPKNVYRLIRKQLKQNRSTNALAMEVAFMIAVKTKRIAVPLSPERCENDVRPFLLRHTERIDRLAKFYQSLSYPTLNLVIRPGEEEYLRLASCLLKEQGGHVITIDYGATFESLTHSFSIDITNDGIFVPPIPHASMEHLPECHNDWTVCAGHIDWTTFIDFTNLAAAGTELGFKTVFYGPQPLLETASEFYDAPGYSIVDNIDWSNMWVHNWFRRHVRNWYGKETAPIGQQRWTGFKALVQYQPPFESPKEVPQVPSTPLGPSAVTEPINIKNFDIVQAPSWPLDSTESDPCWYFDPGLMPMHQFLEANLEASEKDPSRFKTKRNPRLTLHNLDRKRNDELGIRFSQGYEDLQLSYRIVDYMVRLHGCANLLDPNYVSSRDFEKEAEDLVHIWEQDVMTRVLPQVVDAVAQEATHINSGKSTSYRNQHYRAHPYVCTASQTFRVLCGLPDVWQTPPAFDAAKNITKLQLRGGPRWATDGSEDNRK